MSRWNLGQSPHWNGGRSIGVSNDPGRVDGVHDVPEPKKPKEKGLL